ncbi:MAG: hypothetical protein U0T74_01220 [Chitinophagales bacterium]
METKDKIELIKLEYFKLQDFFEGFDNKAQTIKGWNITISIAAIAIGFSYKNEFIWLLAAMTSVVFWVMEGKWRVLQMSFVPRIQEIETAFKLDNFEKIIPLQMSTHRYHELFIYRTNTARQMVTRVTMIPYVYTIIVCLLLFVLKHWSCVEFWSKPQVN